MYIQVENLKIENKSQNKLKFHMNIVQEKQVCHKLIILKHVKGKMKKK